MRMAEKQVGLKELQFLLDKSDLKAIDATLGAYGSAEKNVAVDAHFSKEGEMSSTEIYWKPQVDLSQNI